MISIHAPTWGATKMRNRKVSTFGFQSTHPRGVRRALAGVQVSHARFQSTHPRGVRLQVVYNTLEVRKLFQSTHPRGVRLSGGNTFVNTSCISIHAPTWGATHFSEQQHQ